MTDCNAAKLEHVLNERYGGELHSGAHRSADGKCCVLELVSVCKGLAFTDNPGVVGMPDYRKINDGAWSAPKLRGTHMLRLAVALEAWPEWPEDRRRRFAERLVVRTVNALIAELPHIGEDVARACRAADTLTAGAAAARAARDAALAAPATTAAARAAAAQAAAAAAQAAAAAENPDKVLIRAVDIWVEAAEGSGQ